MFGLKQRSNALISNSNSTSLSSRTSGPGAQKRSHRPNPTATTMNLRSKSSAQPAKYGLTASLSSDAQYAMFRAYEDLLYYELKKVYPNIDLKLNVVKKRWSNAFQQLENKKGSRNVQETLGKLTNL